MAHKKKTTDRPTWIPYAPRKTKNLHETKESIEKKHKKDWRNEND